ncbi:MAG: cytochrome c3 family protein [Syntrophales bacterium]
MKKKPFVLTISILVIAFALTLGAQVGGGDIVMQNSFGEAAFSHERHAGKGLSCQQCHPEPYVTSEKHKTATMKEMDQGASCGLCHNGKLAFTVKGTCTTCHKK